MPTYDYRCKNCGGTFEEVQKITDEPLEKCKLCGVGVVERLITGGTFVLKGTGWYKTDYASSSSSVRSNAPASAKATSAISEGSSDSASTKQQETAASATKPVASSVPSASSKESAA